MMIAPTNITDETTMVEWIYNNEYNDIDWVEVFRNEIDYTIDFYVCFYKKIVWTRFHRVMPIAFLHRFKRFIVDWTTQITFSKEIIPFELLDEVKDKINWTIFSSNPPNWLNEVHLIHFRNNIVWDKLLDALIVQNTLSNFDKKIIITYANFSIDSYIYNSYIDIPYAKTPSWDSSLTL